VLFIVLTYLGCLYDSEVYNIDPTRSPNIPAKVNTSIPPPTSTVPEPGACLAVATKILRTKLKV
jgi:hypothetical protein